MNVRDAPEANSPPPWSRSTMRIVGALAVVSLAISSFVALGIAAIVWAPPLLVVGLTMIAVWTARRRRQELEGRNADEVKDPKSAVRPWPTQGVIDDRLPAGGGPPKDEGR